MTRVGRWAARLALRVHPAAWRARYAPEVSDLIGETDSSLTDAADLLRSAVRERMHGGAPMRFGPAYRHPGGWAVAAAVFLMPTFGVVGVSLIGHELGVTAVATLTDPLVAWLDTVRVLDLALVMAPLVAFVLAVLPLLDLRLERVEGTPGIALRLRTSTANLVVAAVALLTGAALVGHIVTESVLRVGA
jgi:hypothetical protein